MFYTDSNGQRLILDINDIGDKFYYNFDNKYHRLDGPAIEFNLNGSFYWYRNGTPHRVGGPSSYNGIYDFYSWHINGKYINIYYICG